MESLYSTNVKKYNSHVLNKNGLILVKPLESFYVDASEQWKFSYVTIIKEKIEFSLIRKIAFNELKEFGLMDVFKHHIGFLVLKFNTFHNLMCVIAKWSLFLCYKNCSCELFFKPWNEGLFLGVGELVKIWVQL